MGVDCTVLMFDRLISSHSKEHRYNCFVLLVMVVRWPDGGVGDGYCVLRWPDGGIGDGYCV